ncbi:nitroreductase/quinone reductase family protein [Nonomuraea africana]|uniref:nitroreductase/quinone reductase family protein n=1 Tax=Nonomuraea africana TaxID=46171 RepID=UPI0033F7CBB4
MTSSASCGVAAGEHPHRSHLAPGVLRRRCGTSTPPSATRPTRAAVSLSRGSAEHPRLVPQLKANPRVTVESGVFTFEAEAVVLEGAERDAAFARAVEGDPRWADNQAKTTRPGRAPPCSTISTAAAACSACRWIWGKSYHPQLGWTSVRVNGSHPIVDGLRDFDLVDEVYSDLHCPDRGAAPSRSRTRAVAACGAGECRAAGEAGLVRTAVSRRRRTPAPPSR